MAPLRYLLIGIILLWSSILSAHPDGATPFWYPAGYIYGLVEGCANTIEENQVPFTKDMWPVQVKEVCGCVVDSLRHSLTWEEAMDNTTKSKVGMQLIVNATLSICVDEQLNKK